MPWTARSFGVILGLRLTNQPGPLRVPGSCSEPARDAQTGSPAAPAGVCRGLFVSPPRCSWRTRPALHRPSVRRGPLNRPPWLRPFLDCQSLTGIWLRCG